MPPSLRGGAVPVDLARGALSYSVSLRGQEYVQLFQQYPSLLPLYFDFEKTFQADPWTDFARTHPILPLALVAAYLSFCYFGVKMMAVRERFDLRIPLAYWNLLLSLFSFCGFFRTAPHLLNLLATQSFQSTICTDADISYGNGACGLWVALFIYSKVPELLDTVFIVLRKRPLLFLHWFHHVTVLGYCWHAFATESSAGLYFVSMNYGVHAVMYCYYFLMALKIKPPVPPILITILQISQMFVGIVICWASIIYYRSGATCFVNWNNLLAAVAMYGSYLYLFVSFAVKKYFLKTGGGKNE